MRPTRRNTTLPPRSSVSREFLFLRRFSTQHNLGSTRYWDWAIEPTLPDEIAKQETIAVYAPDGNRTIKNPLVGYNFNPVYSDFGDGSKDANGVDDEKTVRFIPASGF